MTERSKRYAWMWNRTTDLHAIRAAALLAELSRHSSASLDRLPATEREVDIMAMPFNEPEGKTITFLVLKRND